MTPKIAFEMSVTNDVMMQVWQAKSDLVLTSPYMIPGETGMQSFRNLERDKVKVTVITNSLAATDEPLVHTGYSRYRPRMLEAGVDLYELSPTRAQQTKRLGMFGSSLGRLHAKTAVIDRRIIFIGSMNLDPRSASTNTEFGMFIESAPLAKELLRVINISKLESAYRLRLDPKTVAAAMADARGRQGGHPQRRARVDLLAARAQHAARLVRSREAPLKRAAGSRARMPTAQSSRCSQDQ